MTTDPHFALAVAIVLDLEGVFSDDPGDPGGVTCYGIARASHPSIPWPPSRDQAIAIYRADYWDAHRCGEMPWQWAVAVFDGAVNQGGGSAVRLAQRALGVVVDGEVGPASLAAMRGKAGPDAYRTFIAARAAAYSGNAGFARFGSGWLRRLVRIVQAGEHAPA